MKLGSHIANCCFIHGCKYNSSCPILEDDMPQHHPCPKCSNEDKDIIEARRKKIHKDTPEEWASKLTDKELFDHLDGLEWDDNSLAVLNEMMKRFLTKE